MKKRITPVSKFALVKETIAHLEDGQPVANAAATNAQAAFGTTTQSTPFCTGLTY